MSDLRNHLGEFIREWSRGKPGLAEFAFSLSHNDEGAVVFYRAAISEDQLAALAEAVAARFRDANKSVTLSCEESTHTFIIADGGVVRM